MHKLLLKDETWYERFLTLENMETGTVDYCFDNSDYFNGSYFPMEKGKTYECMICLFGDLTWGKTDSALQCHVIRDDIVLGTRKIRLVEVKSGEDIYYVRFSEVKDVVDEKTFVFYYARKDLIMVDGMLNGLYDAEYLDSPTKAEE